jgi:hypothetical protein
MLINRRQPRNFIPDPAAIVPPALRVAWYRSDTGVTSAASRVGAWANIWSGGDLAQATAGAKPLLVSATINGFDGVKSDDGTRFMDATLSPQIASGSRAYVWMFARTDTNATSKRYFTLSAGGSNPSVQVRSSSAGSLWAFVYSDGTVGATVNSTVGLSTIPALTEVGLTIGGAGVGAASGTIANGTAAGVANAALTSFSLFSNGLGSTTVSPQATVAEIVVMGGIPDHARKIAMRQYFRNRYGAI